MPKAVWLSGLALFDVFPGHTRAALITSVVGLIGIMISLRFIIAHLSKRGPSQLSTLHPLPAGTLLGPVSLDASPPDGAAASGREPAPTGIQIGVQQVHACPRPHADDPQGTANGSNSDFDLFVALKIENETQSARSVKACRLKITLPDGTSQSGERISGDLDKWRIDADREEWDLWDTYFTTEAKPIPEFGMAEPLGPGDHREGWLHFLARNTSSPEIQTCSMEVVVEDSLAITHLGAVNCFRHVPGKVHLSEESPA